MIRRFVHFLFLVLFSLIEASDDEYRLFQDLKKNYDVFERPVMNSSLPLNVKLRVFLQQILDVDEKNQVIQLVVWLQFTWNDYKLRWNPDEYGGITDIRYPGNPSAIWKPDVLLYNSADENFDSTYPCNYIVSHDGSVLQAPPGIIKASCKIDITWLPFDDQLCFLKFGSWTYSGSFIDLEIDMSGLNETHTMDLTYYVKSGSWTILQTPAILDVKVFANEPYPSIFFFLHIRRRTLYYILNLILPCLVITMMTILGFTLPPDAGEKITLEITILLSVCFFLNMVAGMTPPTSEAIPLIGAFFSCCMMVVSASVVFTVLVLNLHFRKPEIHPMTPFLRSILIVWLPWLLFISKSGIKDNSRKDEPFLIADKVLPTSDSMNLLRNVKITKINLDASVHDKPKLNTQLANNNFTPKFNLTSDSFASKPQELEAPTLSMHRTMLKACIELRNIGADVRFMTKRMKEDDDDKNAENDWKFAAMVVDRLCLILFTIFIVIIACSILSSPSIFDL